MNKYYLSKVLARFNEGANKRPLLIPAVTILIFMGLTLKAGLIVASCIGVLISILIISINRNFTSLLTLLMLIYLICSCISMRYGMKVNSISNKDYYDYKVISVKDKLDGSSEVILNSKDTYKVLLRSAIDTRPNLGSTIRILNKPVVPYPSTNPGEFDYKDYLKREAINYIYYDEAYTYVSGETPGLREKFIRGVYNLKRRIVNTFEVDGGMAGSIFLGDTSLIDETVKNDFRLSNCSHLLAVSGTHFSGFLVMLSFIFTRIKGRRLKSVIYVIFCLGICMLTGFTSSVTRAAIVSLCVFFTRDKISGLSVGTILTAVINPVSVISMSFLMSYTICLSIFVFARRIESICKRRFSDKISSTISVIISSQIGLIPFWVTLNPRFGLILFGIQFLASSVATLACTLFLPSVLLSILHPGLNLICRSSLWLIRGITSIGANVPYLFNLGRLPGLLTFIILIGITLLLIPGGIIRKVLVRIFVVLGILGAVIGSYSYLTSPDVKVIFIDVGQGDSILILGDKSILIDGGTYDSGSTVASVLDYYGVVVPDVIIATHYDEDHFGGIRYLIDEGRSGDVYCSYTEPNMSGIKLIHSGDVFNFKAFSLRCLNPDRNGIYIEDNDKSVVLELVSSSCKILFTGDIPSDIEDDLIRNNKLSDVDILKAAHHGSRYSTSDRFIKVVQPEYTVISVGKYNNYGHPSKEVITRLKNNNSKIYDTRYSGAVIVDIYSEEYEIKPYLATDLSQASTMNVSSAC